MIRIAAVVVLFNPDLKEVEQNVLSYLSEVDRLYCVDNTNGGHKENSWLFDGTNSKVRYIQNEKNLGIAAALNIGCNKAIEDKYEWILTMDQDSSFDKAEIVLYAQQINELNFRNENIGIFYPSEVKKTIQLSYTEAAHRITSGSCINLSVFQKVSGFDSRLFIDEVDEDYACKVEKAGYRMIGFDNIKMIHQLGVTKKTGIFGLFLIKQRTVHSPFRLYFMVRNYLYVSTKYRADFPVMFERRDKEFRTMLKNNILYSDSFVKSFFRAVKGYIDFKMNRF